MDISVKLLIFCNLLAPMDANGGVGAGFSISYIKSRAAFFASYLLDTPVILLLSGGGIHCI